MINNSNYIINEFPEFHPISQRYEKIEWWKDFKRKCIEGMWSGGKWCPGNLYFYVNAWNIRLESKYSSGKILGKPWFRDLEWEKAWNYMEAKGFSGFAEDKEYTCHRWLGPEKEFAEELGLIDISIDRGIFSKEDLNKKYMPAREYLRMNHGVSKGKPQFRNSAKNIVDMESREGGKSFFAAGAEIAHNFLFDGATDYDAYLEAKRNKTPMSSETLVGAIDSTFSSDLLKKFTLGLENLPGSVEYNGVTYPSPLWLNYSGTISKSGQSITTLKSKSIVKHVSFADDPLAGAGTRPQIAVLEEVGFMHNIEEVLGGLEDCVAQDGTQYGVIHMFGTGGLVKGSAAVHMEKIFRNPDDYNALVFDDLLENKGKIGYFVSAAQVINKFKEGPNLESNLEKATKSLLHKREKLKKGSSVKYMSEVINRPLFPSEMFISMDSNYFPAAELRDQISRIEGNKEKYIDSIWVGDLKFNEHGRLEWESDDENLHPIREYPLGKGASKEGAIEIFEMPQKNSEGFIPFGKYIAGIDTFDKDLSGTDSLGAIYIMNRDTGKIVACYIGRPQTSKLFYEKCRRLLMFYNAKGMYEKNLTGLFTYFENQKSLHLLAETPPQFRDTSTYKEGTNTAYGINASERTNRVGREHIKTWLWEKVSENAEITNLMQIRSIVLLKELTLWNKDGNFDSVSALGMLMWLDQTMYKSTEQDRKKVKSISEHDYWAKFGLIKKQTA